MVTNKDNTFIYTGWLNKFTGVNSIKQTIQDAIKHPKFLVESNGVKMRAYMSKTGESIMIKYQDLSASMTFNSHDSLLTALGFTPDNIMPSILHGKG
jgi:uncharacterized hydantoinase/oxoprolinase family protein